MILQDVEQFAISFIHESSSAPVLRLRFCHLESVPEAASLNEHSVRASLHPRPCGTKCGSSRDAIAIYSGPYKSGSASSLAVHCLGS
jgi:hypothetical protein